MPPARTATERSTVAGSTSWLNTASMTGCSDTGSFEPGVNVCTRGGGVSKVAVAAVAKVPPLSDFAPAGTVIVYRVAIGRRSTLAESAVNRSVSVPIQSQ